MASLTRNFPWRTTPVGPIEQWPDLLLTTVNTLLAARQPMFLWWGSDLIQFYNDAYRPNLGADKHPSALGQGGAACWPEIWPTIGPQIDSVRNQGSSIWYEDQLIPIFRDGSLVDVYWTYSYSPVRGVDGTICGVLVICADTTGRVEADARSRRLYEAVQESEERVRIALSATNSVGIWDWDVQKDCFIADENFARIYGVDPLRAAVGVPLAEFTRNIHPEDQVDLQAVIAAALETGSECNAEYRLVQPDGSSRWVAVRGRCVLAPDGTPLRFPGVTIDITEQKLTTAALIQNEKLAAVGRLAASIAHEINNPLQSITDLLYLSRSSDSIDEVHEYLDTAERELRRVAVISTQALQFHRQATNPVPVRGSELIDSILTMYHGRIVNTRIDVRRRDRARKTVQCFEGEIRQVLSNIVSNAIDSMQVSGGRLLLRTRSATGWSTGQPGVLITIADTGTGMSAKTQAKAFQAFFTTKGIGGTGLGLWISREIVERHQGILKLRSSNTPGRRGTVFSIFLPYDSESR